MTPIKSRRLRDAAITAGFVLLSSSSPPKSAFAQAAVSNVSITFLSSASLTVSWNINNGAPAAAAAQSTPTIVLSTVSNFSAQISSGPGVLLQAATTYSQFTAAPFPLIPNTTYFFEVKNSTEQPDGTAYVGFNAGFSTATLASPPLVAAAPVTSSFTNVTAGQISALWSQNGNPSSPPNLTTYTVVAATANFIGSGLAVIQAAAQSVTVSTAPASLNNGLMTVTVGGLASNTSYYFYIAAVNCNSVVTSTYAFLGNAVTLSTSSVNPPVPAANAFILSSTYSLTPSWGANGNTAALPFVTTYTVTLSTVGSSAGCGAVTCSIAAGASAAGALSASTAPAGATLWAYFPGLTADTTYYLYVSSAFVAGSPTGTIGAPVAADVIGSIAAGSTATLAQQPVQGGGSPPGFFNLYTTSATVTWGANGNSTGTYVVEFSTVPTLAQALVQSTAGVITLPTVNNSTGAAGSLGATPTATLTGLGVNTTYFLYVAASNWSGNLNWAASPLGAASTLANPPLVAAAPVVSSFTNVAAGQISAIWSQNGNPSAPPSTTTYLVVVATANFIGGSLAGIQASAGTLAFSTSPVSLNNGPMMATIAQGLNPNTSYFFYIAAVNGNGVTSSTYAFLGNAVTLGTGTVNPPLPSANAFVPAGATTLSPTWSANGNGSAPPFLTTYTVTLSTVGSTAGCGAATCSVAAGLSAAGALSESTAPAGPMLMATFPGLAVNTSYYLYVSSAFVAGSQTATIGAPVAADVIGSIPAGSASTLTNPPLAAAAPITSSFTNVAAAQISVLWSQNGNPSAPPRLTTYTVVATTFTVNYIGASLAALQASSGSITFSTAPVSYNNGPMMATVVGLSPLTSYYPQ